MTEEEKKITEQQGINFGEEYDTKGEFKLIDDGKYEVVIEKVEPKVSTKGTKYLNITFKIRDDVDQNFKKRKLFYRVTAKEGDRTGYDFDRLNKIVLTQKNKETYKNFFLDTDEILQYLIGLHLIITVETAYDEYTQAERNNVKDWAFEPSIWDTQEHPAPVVKEHTEQLEATAKEAEKVLDLPDDDLPF